MPNTLSTQMEIPIKSTDIDNQPVTLHTTNKDKENAAATTVQTAWRQFYRANYLHKHPNLFGPNSIYTPNNYFNAESLPVQFRHLALNPLPLLIPTTKHHSDNLRDILHDGVIYPKKVSKITGFGSEEDESRFDERLVFTAPHATYSNDFITLDTQLLFKYNHYAGVYFKLNDWVLSHEFCINLSNVSLNISINKDFKGIQYGFHDIKTQSIIYQGELPSELSVYHGLRGLNEYLLFFIFKIIESLPDQYDLFKKNIYEYFARIDSHHQLIPSLELFAKNLIEKSELDFVNKLILRFDMIKKLTLNSVEIDLDKLRKKIVELDLSYIIALFNDTDFGRIVQNSYFLAKGIYDFSEKYCATEISEYLSETLHNILSLPNIVAEHTKVEKSIRYLDASNYTKIHDGQRASTDDIGIYRKIFGDESYYFKFYPDSDHSRAEVLAARLYQLAGITVPETTLVQKNVLNTETMEFDGSLGVASRLEEKIIPINGQLINYADLTGCHEGFLVDAWLCNWDVVGLYKDNLQVIYHGNNILTSLRLDFGGALQYRAQGALKPDFFDSEDVPEIASLRDKNINENAADVFCNISDNDLKIGASKLKRISDEQIADAVFSCYPEENYKSIRDSLCKTLCSRRNYLINQYQVTLDDPIELIARDIISQHYQQPEIKLKHGAMHVSRTAINIAIFAQLYRNKGYQISPADIKLMQIAALFHDAGRQHDQGDDKPEWEQRGQELCYQYLLSLGVDRMKAIAISDSIGNKDSTTEHNRKKSIYRKLMQNADCLDVLRSEHWKFDYTFLDYYKEFFASTNSSTINMEDLFFRVIDESAQLIATTSDLHQDFDTKSISGYYVPANWSLAQKTQYECSKKCYEMIKEKLCDMPLLQLLYQQAMEGIILNHPEERAKGNKRKQDELDTQPSHPPHQYNLRSKDKKNDMATDSNSTESNEKHTEKKQKLSIENHSMFAKPKIPKKMHTKKWSMIKHHI